MATTVYLKDAKRFNSEMILPHVGKVKVSGDGSFEVEDADAAEMLCDELPILCTMKKKDQDTTLTKTNVVNPVGEDAEKQYLEQLSSPKVTMKDLKALAEGLPEEEWGKLQKRPLIEYLAKKLAEKDANTTKLPGEDEEGSEEHEGDGETGKEGGEGNDTENTQQ